MAITVVIIMYDIQGQQDIVDHERLCSGGPVHHPDCPLAPPPASGAPTERADDFLSPVHCGDSATHQPHRWGGPAQVYCCGSNWPPDPALKGTVREAPVERCHHGYATAVCGPCYRGEDGPPAEWLMVWFAGHLAGYATGYEHGQADGEQEYGSSLQEALAPMRRAAAHGIDVRMARAAWESQRAREHQLGGGGQDA
jgi:hypothetical protein